MLRKLCPNKKWVARVAAVGAVETWAVEATWAEAVVEIWAVAVATWVVIWVIRMAWEEAVGVAIAATMITGAAMASTMVDLTMAVAAEVGVVITWDHGIMAVTAGTMVVATLPVVPATQPAAVVVAIGVTITLALATNKVTVAVPNAVVAILAITAPNPMEAPAEVLETKWVSVTNHNYTTYVQQKTNFLSGSQIVPFFIDILTCNSKN